MTLRIPEKFCCKPQKGQLAPKFPIFKMAENPHGAQFHVWDQNVYNLYILGKEVLSGLILSEELGSKNGHISSY